MYKRMKGQQVAGRRINMSWGQLIWSCSTLAGRTLISPCFLVASTVGEKIIHLLCVVF